MMKIKRLTNMTSESYILIVDAYGLFLHWSEKNGNIYDVKIEFNDTHPSFGNKIKEYSIDYDIEDIDVKTFTKEVSRILKAFGPKLYKVDTQSMTYEDMYEKRYVLAYSNRLLRRILDAIACYVEHPMGLEL